MGALFAASLAGALLFAPAADPLDSCNVVWTTPSADSSGSMPLGNGDLGANVWVEANGDLLAYLSKTDAWDATGRLLKLGRLRVHLDPNPFAAGRPFRQTLRLRQGEILIEAAPVTVRVWADAHAPVLRVEAASEQPLSVTVGLEVWRTAPRTLTGGELFSLFLVQGLLTCITFGIYGAWATAKIAAYMASKLKWGADAFACNMEGGKLFSINLKGILLTGLTLGIYSAWYQAELTAYQYDCTTVG